MPRAWLALLILAPMLVLGAPPSDAEHRKLVEQAAKAWNEGRYPEAIKALEAARAIKPSSRVIFNLARAYEKHGDLELAIKTYEAYLEAPDAEAAVMKRTRTLLGALYKQTAKQDAEPVKPAPDVVAVAEPEKKPADAPVKEPVITPSVSNPPPVVIVSPPPAPAPRPLRVTGIVLLVAGAAGVGAGVGVGAWAQGTATSARMSVDPAQKPALVSAAQGRATAADVTWVAGASTAALGGLLLLVDALSSP